MIRFAGLLLILIPSVAFSCPLIGGQVDHNCDQMHKVVIIGDSIVKGIGDLENNNRGGYVLRLQKKFKKSLIVNLGMPGYSTARIYSQLKSRLDKRNKNSIKTAIKDADVIFLDAGRNDYFEEFEPGMTVKNLEQIVGVLRNDFAKRDEVAPIIKVATLLPTTRAFQRSFIIDVNKLLIEFSSDNLPVRLYLNLISDTVISNDGIHPYSDGYKVIANYLSLVLKGGLKEEELNARPDLDKDGIYDMFEKSKFGTNPNKADTDDDGFLDGDEVFNLGTDPTGNDAPPSEDSPPASDS